MTNYKRRPDTDFHSGDTLISQLHLLTSRYLHKTFIDPSRNETLPAHSFHRLVHCFHLGVTLIEMTGRGASLVLRIVFKDCYTDEVDRTLHGSGV